MAQRRLQHLKLDTQAPPNKPKPIRSHTEFTLGGDNEVAIEEEIVEDTDGVSPLPLNPSASTPSNHVSQLRQQLRERGTSITFDSTVKLEDGHERHLLSPLPKQQDSKGKGRADRTTQPLQIPFKARPRRHSDAETDEYDLRTGAPIDQHHHVVQNYHRGEMRHPLLQSTVDELASVSSHPPVADKLPSLTSDYTASPLSEDIGTPANGSALGPSAPSPITIDSGRSDSLLPSRRSVSQRSFGSLGSVGRRHTIKSAGSSLSSPARSYLSQWRSNGPAAREPEPDDEGQEIRGAGPIYIIGRKIGFGGFSVVKEATTMEGDISVVRAVKIVRKQIKDISDSENERIQQDFDREVDVWRYLRHKYILPLIAAYSTEFATFCITKLNRDGTLFDLIAAHRRATPRGEWGLSTHLAQRYSYQLGSAIRYLHEDEHIVHRDIKPENCLLDLSAPDAATVGGNLLLCDFGMADWITSDARPADDAPSPGGNVGPSPTSTAIQGSLEYAAPEMLSAGRPIYSPAADMWAYGCVLYTLLTAELPFKHEFQPRLVMMISRGAYDMDKLVQAPAARDVGGHGAVDLVAGCLHADSEERLVIGDVLEMPWLDGCKALYEDADFA
jgi:serine/threonine protein kinase